MTHRRSILARLLPLLGLALPAAMALLGCEARLPTFPTPVSDPEVTVQRVDLVTASDQASRYDVVVTLTNPNDVALPLTGSAYTLNVNGETYKGDALPNATLPADGSVTVTLPAVVTTPAGQAFETSGSIEYFPPGQIKRLFYDMGIPKPRASFRGTGNVTPKPVEEPRGPRRGGRIETDPVPPPPDAPLPPAEPRLPPTSP